MTLVSMAIGELTSVPGTHSHFKSVVVLAANQPSLLCLVSPDKAEAVFGPPLLWYSAVCSAHP